jgi:hypothetical protein
VHLHVADAGGGLGALGNHGGAEAEPGGLGEPPLLADDPADLAGEPDLAEHHEPGRQRAVARGGGHREGDGEVGGGLGEAHAADGGGVDLGVVQPDPAAPLQHREDHGDPGGVQAADRAPGRRDVAARDERLHLGQQRALALHGHGDRGAGHHGAQRRGVGEEQPGRVGHPVDAVVAQLEAAHLVGRAVAVLDAAHHAQRGVLVALEVQHHVDQVLQHPGSGDRAVLCDMSHENDRQAALLGERGERHGHRPYLGDAAR